MLSVQADFEVVGEAGNGEQALRQARALCPDVVLMDLRMPVLDGVAATRQLCASDANCREIVLTTFDDDEYIFEGLRAGALGYLLKDVAPDVLFEAVRAAARGESVLQPSVAAKVVAQFARLADRAPRQAESLVEPLSDRELEVLGLIAEGRTNREIGTALYIAEGTVKNTWPARSCFSSVRKHWAFCLNLCSPAVSSIFARVCVSMWFSMGKQGSVQGNKKAWCRNALARHSTGTCLPLRNTVAQLQSCHITTWRMTLLYWTSAWCLWLYQSLDLT